MMTAMRVLKTWQDEYLTLVTRLEGAVVRLTARASESVADYVPERPRWALPEGAPTITEFVDSQLKFRRRVVDEQTAFVRKFKAMHPALTKLETKSTAVPQPAVKSVAKRPTARRDAVRRAQLAA